MRKLEGMKLLCTRNDEADEDRSARSIIRKAALSNKTGRGQASSINNDSKVKQNITINAKINSCAGMEGAGSAAVVEAPRSIWVSATRNHDLHVHAVQISFPPPILSCVENAPLVGQVSHVIAPSSRMEPLKLSSKESSSEAIQDVHISTRLMDEFMELARSNTEKDLETCGILGAFLENRTFYVTTLIVPKQESTSSSCQALNEEEICAIQEELSCFPAGWIHTHPSQTCFMSSIDLHTQYSYQVMLPAALAIVMAPTDASRKYGIFRISNEGIHILKDCQERGFHTHRETADGSPLYEDCFNVYFNPNLRFEVIDLRCPQ